jgi:SAM-dependent methyltransferase
VVELQQDLAVAHDLLVLIAAVAALSREHALVEAAGRRDVADDHHRLRPGLRSHDASLGSRQHNGETALYDRIGTTYSATRATEPRIAGAIRAALGDARSVVNVGAGAGAYEPTDLDVLAVEPSAAMIAQRPPGSAPAVRARAESLPLADTSFDAALAVNTVHHWDDLAAGLRELRRVARKRIVIFRRDGQKGTPLWLVERYLPVLAEPSKSAAIAETIERELGPVTEIPVALPHDCSDGLFSAYWARPEAYLDAAIRRNISNFALASGPELAEGLARLEADLESGEWDRRYGQLRSLPELDLGHRIVVAELALPS